MHKEILTKQQKKLLPILKDFSDNFGLVGGTAIALYIGHRKSIDFDLFSLKEFSNLSIKKKISKKTKIEKLIINIKDEFTFLAEGVRFTFFYYPYKIRFSENIDSIISMPDLLTLAAMKAHALGQRAKWKDYVDLYFILAKYHSIKQIVKKAKQIFGREFNEKIFRTQLAYHKDINYEEKIMFAKGFEAPEETIKKELIKFSLE